MKAPVLELVEIISEMGNMVNVVYIQVFLYLVVIDIFTGFAKSFINKQANSTKGLLGILKHFATIVMVLTVYPYLVALNLQGIATIFVTFFIGSYGISVVENWGQMGGALPLFVKQYFEKLKRESSEIDINQMRIFVEKKEETQD